MSALNTEFSSASQKTAAGIFLPTSATSNPLPEAMVIAVGPGAPNKDGNVVPTSVKAGDKVLLPGWGGNSIKLGEEVSSITSFSRPFLKYCWHSGILLIQGLRDSGKNTRMSTEHCRRESVAHQKSGCITPSTTLTVFISHLSSIDLIPTQMLDSEPHEVLFLNEK
jgi:co-chaperonin GroES (HSP10)